MNYPVAKYFAPCTLGEVIDPLADLLSPGSYSSGQGCLCGSYFFSRFPELDPATTAFFDVEGEDISLIMSRLQDLLRVSGGIEAAVERAYKEGGEPIIPATSTPIRFALLSDTQEFYGNLFTKHSLMAETVSETGDFAGDFAGAQKQVELLIEHFKKVFGQSGHTEVAALPGNTK